MADVADIYQMRTYVLAGGQAGINVLHFYVSSKAGTGATDTEIGQAFNTATAAVLKACLSANASFRGTSIRKIAPAVGLEQFNITGQGAGGVAGDLMPKQVSGIITWRTALPGRAYRGRSYVAFPGEADNDVDATPTAGYLTRLTALANAWDVPITAGAAGNTNLLKLAIYHRVFAGTTLVDTYTVRDRWATQRRRGDYGRTNLLPI